MVHAPLQVALLRLCKPSGRLVTLVQAMTASRLGPSQLGGSSQASQGLSQGLSQQVTASQAAILEGAAGMEAPGTVQVKLVRQRLGQLSG